jgi:hypothetical protein
MEKPINNLESIIPLLDFKSEDDFYFVQIIKRRKENPEITVSCRQVATYIITSVEQLRSVMDEIIEIAEQENARVYINPNKRNAHDIAIKLLEYYVGRLRDDKNNKEFIVDIIFISLLIEDKQYYSAISKYQSKANHLIGKHSSEKDKKWIIDVDDKERKDYGKLLLHIISIQEKANRKALHMHLETKNGYHIVTRPFNPKDFDYKHEIKKDSPTILYIPMAKTVGSYKWAEMMMREGKKVRLPEWRGYWFLSIDETSPIPVTTIKALTKDGDIVPAWVDDERITSRTDWEVADGLDFGWALCTLKAGKKVRRSGWNGKGMYLWMLPGTVVPLEWIKEEHLKQLAMINGNSVDCLPSIRMKTADNKVLTGWLASQTDMFATDWELAD